jgi:hypothetical protein
MLEILPGIGSRFGDRPEICPNGIGKYSREDEPQLAEDLQGTEAITDHLIARIDLRRNVEADRHTQSFLLKRTE